MPVLVKMKGMDIFCASQAAISCLSMDEPSSSSSSTIHLGGSGRAIDRYNPIIRDPKRFGGSRTTLPNFIPASCSSQPPISPKHLSQSHHHKNHHQQNKNRVAATKNSSKPSNEKSHNSNTNKKKIKINNKSSPAIKPPPPSDQEKQKSSRSITATAAVVHDQPNDFRITSAISSTSSNRKSWSCSSKGAPGDFISPPDSSRCLLSTDQAAFFNLISEDFDPVVKLLPPVVEAEPPLYSKYNNNNKALQKDDQSTCSFKRPISSSSRFPDQVVVLRVSLHCRGCERKMRKHISRMEGVSSFNIDFAAKKVTVVGNVTPLGVLASISKVKNAQLWTPAAAAAVASSSHGNSSEISKNRAAVSSSSHANSSEISKNS